MRRPIHANSDHMVLAATVFESNGRKAIVEATGADPSAIARAVSNHKSITPLERSNLRKRVREALMAMRDKSIPNLDFCQINVGDRRVRLKTISG